jgi:hypothetical protein
MDSRMDTSLLSSIVLCADEEEDHRAIQKSRECFMTISNDDDDQEPFTQLSHSVKKPNEQQSSKHYVVITK